MGSLLVLIAAWWFGGIEISERQISTLNALIEKNQELVKVEDNLYQIYQNGEQLAWLGIGQGIGYGGELNVTIRMGLDGEIEQISILSIKDTSSYVTKVIESGFVQTLLNFDGKNAAYSDAISGATLSSNGIVNAVNNAADPIRKQIFGYQLQKKESPLDSVSILDGCAIIMFLLAVYVSRSKGRHKVKLQWILMLISLAVFGFHSASLISSSTVSILLSGSWVAGLGNYTPLVLLGLAVGYLLLFNKNVYCQIICPMGVTQRCLSKLTNAKAVSIKHKAFLWFPRGLFLVALAGGLYFRNPSAFGYAPFGIMFSMVGSIYLFIPTVLVLLTSLLVQRPWCKTLCPINVMADYLLFMKNWHRQVAKPKRNRRSKAIDVKVEQE